MPDVHSLLQSIYHASYPWIWGLVLVYGVVILLLLTYSRGMLSGLKSSLQILPPAKSTYSLRTIQNKDSTPDLNSSLGLLLLDSVVVVNRSNSDLTLNLVVDNMFNPEIDFEPITYEDSFAIAQLYVKYDRPGVARWVALKRGIRPFPSVQKSIKKLDAWIPALDDLSCHPGEIS